MDKPEAVEPQESTAAESVMYMGDCVKATRTDDGLKVAGYLVRFTDEKSTDLEGEFFDGATDYDIDEFPNAKTTYFNHGTDAQLKRRKLGKATLTEGEFGIWAETILEERDEYEKFVAQLAVDGKLGWSSGTAGHLMERDGKHITKWPIVEASLTHTPAEFRNSVQPVKSLIVEQPEAASEAVEPETHEEPAPEPIKQTPIETEESNIMEQEAIQKMIDDAVAKASETAANKAVEEYRKSEPAEKTASVVVTKDEGDQEFETIGKFFQAVKNATLYPSNQDKRLASLKATGANETVGADGGFLVPTATAGGILQRMYDVGKLLPLVSKDPVSGNSMTYNAVDESSRASTRHGGVLGYWLAEASDITASKPAFRQIDLKLKKVAALAYATDELLADQAALESWLSREVPNELVFMAEDAIYNGNGVGKPLGFMNSPCLIESTREDASKVQVSDVLGMWSRRWAGAGDNYVWFINQNVFPQIMQLNNAYQNMFMPQGYAGSPVNTLLGKPIIETEYSASLGTVGDIVLADMSQYQAIDKSIQSASSIHVNFVGDETAFRFIYRIDGEPTWNAALTPFKGTTRSPFVALAAST